MATLTGTTHYSNTHSGAIPALQQSKPATHAGMKTTSQEQAFPYTFLLSISERSLTREIAITNVLATAGIGMWSFNVFAKQLHLCPTAGKLMDIQDSHTFNLNALTRQLAQWQVNTLVSTARMACKTGHAFEQEIRLTSNGADKWLKITGKLYCSDGIAMKMLGTITDITISKC